MLSHFPIIIVITVVSSTVCIYSCGNVCMRKTSEDRLPKERQIAFSNLLGVSQGDDPVIGGFIFYLGVKKN